MPHKLLLADDSVTIQRVIELTFADEDVQVVAVGNGQEAIDRAQRDRPDIVLADVGMPERNGYEVAAFIKGTPALASIPVVLLTGAFEPIDEARAKAVGCDGVLVKPFEPQLVISRVKDLLAGKQPAGMWSAAPTAQGSLRPAQSGQRGGPRSNDPLEAYFDHLDAAFALPGTNPDAPAAAGSSVPREAMPASARPAAGATSGGDDFAGWDPDLAGDPSRPASLPTPLIFPPSLPSRPAADSTAVAAPPPAARTTDAGVAAAPAPGAANRPVPSLTEAFAALLAAEQQIGLAPSTAAIPLRQPARTDDGQAPLADTDLDRIVERVLARFSEQARPLVLDTAERLVREELDRIKKHV